MNPLNHIGYAIIGTADGFDAQTAGILAGKDIGAVVDLDNREVATPPDTELMAGIRQVEGDSIINYFVIYRHALELDRNRSGAFYGAVVALKNCQADGFAVYTLLLELATNVKVYLDPSNQRFLVPFQDINFLKPSSLEDLTKSVKPLADGLRFGNEAFYTTLPGKARSLFRFIDTFQGAEEVQKVFASNDEAVSTAVINKQGIPIKSLELGLAKVEESLERLDHLEQDLLLKEKEVEALKEKRSAALTALEQATDHKASASEELETLEQSIQALRQEYKALEEQKEKETSIQSPGMQAEKAPESQQPESFSTYDSPQQPESLWQRLHPIAKAGLLILGFLIIAVAGYYFTQTSAQETTTSDGPSREMLMKSNEYNTLRLVEQLGVANYRSFNQQKHDQLLKEINRLKNSPEKEIQQKAVELQRKVLNIGVQHFASEMEKNKDNKERYFQVVENYEVMKSKYDSLLSIQ